MWELRWVLIGLGAALILGVYLWGKGVVQRFVPMRAIRGAWAASRWRAQSPAASPAESSPEDRAAAADPDVAEKVAVRARAPDRVVTVRFIPKEQALSTEKAILALRAAGLQHGRYGIFHRAGEHGIGDPMFSVANLTEPGSFDLTNLPESTIAGMSFFMELPGSGDPITRFDSMVATARSLAHELNAELHDERGSSWSIQRERYVREELIEYRHQHGRA